MPGWTIDSAMETEITASKPQGSLDDVTALLKLVAKELNIPIGHIGHGGVAAKGWINTAKVIPQRGYEEGFAAGVKAYNEAKAKKE